VRGAEQRDRNDLIFARTATTSTQTAHTPRDQSSSQWSECQVLSVTYLQQPRLSGEGDSLPANLSFSLEHRRQFPPGPWVTRDPTTSEAWSGPNIGGPAQLSKFSQCEEISNRCFCHVSWHVGHCIPFQSVKLDGSPTLDIVT